SNAPGIYMAACLVKKSSLVKLDNFERNLFDILKTKIIRFGLNCSVGVSASGEVLVASNNFLPGFKNGVPCTRLII
ncbi:MAG: hypothetical protein KDD56_07880, partial [Bdellovibrionales bacterium]|nr:hypothetical protein [Bdellovibrionales bacterium]